MNTKLVTQSYSYYKNKFSLLCFMIMLSTINIYSQVTIGSGIAPDSDALLDLKEFPDNTSKKGLLLPRVFLSSKDSPSPLKNHIKGMFVYNTADIDMEIYPGCYYNNGNQWLRIGAGFTSEGQYTVSNGLHLNGNNIKLGGALSEATSITGISSTNQLSFIGEGKDAINFNNNTLSIDASNKRVGIGTNDPAATLDVRGTVRITESSGTPNNLLGRNTTGDISNITLGNGLAFSNGTLSATAGTSTTVYAYLINYTIKAYNVPSQTTPIIPASNDYTVWISGKPNVGADQPHIQLPIARVGRVINVVAAAGDIRVSVAGILGGTGWITSSNGVNETVFTIPSRKRASFQYIGNEWDYKGTWIVMMKDF